VRWCPPTARERNLAPNILLILGTRTRAHLAEGLGAADVRLDAAARAELAGAGIALSMIVGLVLLVVAVRLSAHSLALLLIGVR
jgi:hypothetical protein